MIEQIKNFLKRYLFFKKILETYSLSHEYLKATGWMRSWELSASVDQDGHPIPWLSYPAIAFLKDRIKPDFQVFEYGAGASTLWFARQVRSVVSCEHEEAWFKRVQQMTAGLTNVELFFVPLAEGYSTKIQDYKKQFDVIVIDGRQRNQCAMNSLEALNDRGVLLFDNADRAAYQEGITFLLCAGFKKIDFTGLTPLAHRQITTAIFYKNDNCLGI